MERMMGMGSWVGGMGGVVIKLLTSWWEEINESTLWQEGIFYTLCAAYAVVALIQLIRIEVRVPQYGWTTQKVFHPMNFVANGVQAVAFGFHDQVFCLHPKVLTWVLLDLPGLLFFSTDTLLVLYSAEIYHQIYIWLYLWIKKSIVQDIGKVFIAGVSIISASGFLLYGGRLLLMLRRFPVESKSRRKKLHEVGAVAAICFACFLMRSFMMLLSAFESSNVSLYPLDHPILNFAYYMLLEILPSALVPYILRELPPRRISTQYHPIRWPEQIPLASLWPQS